MKLLILGGSGQLSGRLAQLAMKDGHQVWTLTRGQRPLLPGVHGLVADRNDPTALRNALASAHMQWDAVVDCICRTPAHAHINLAVLPAFVKRQVVVSTDSVYDPYHKQVPQGEETDYYLHDGGYGDEKRQMEEVLFSPEGADMCTTVFRPGHIFGPGFQLGCYQEHFRQKDLLSHIRADKPLRLVDKGSFLIHPIYVDDLVRSMLACIDNPLTYGEIFCIGGPDVITNAEYYACIGRLVGHPVTIENIPLEGYMDAHPESSGQLCHRSYTLEKLRRTGVPLPATPFEEGIRRHIAWLDAQA